MYVQVGGSLLVAKERRRYAWRFAPGYAPFRSPGDLNAVTRQLRTQRPASSGSFLSPASHIHAMCLALYRRAFTPTLLPFLSLSVLTRAHLTSPLCAIPPRWLVLPSGAPVPRFDSRLPLSLEVVSFISYFLCLFPPTVLNCPTSSSYMRQTPRTPFPSLPLHCSSMATPPTSSTTAYGVRGADANGPQVVGIPDLDLDFMLDYQIPDDFFIPSPMLEPSPRSYVQDNHQEKGGQEEVIFSTFPPQFLAPPSTAVVQDQAPDTSYLHPEVSAPPPTVALGDGLLAFGDCGSSGLCGRTYWCNGVVLTADLSQEAKMPVMQLQPEAVTHYAQQVTPAAAAATANFMMRSSPFPLKLNENACLAEVERRQPLWDQAKEARSNRMMARMMSSGSRAAGHPRKSYTTSSSNRSTSLSSSKRSKRSSSPRSQRGGEYISIPSVIYLDSGEAGFFYLLLQLFSLLF